MDKQEILEQAIQKANSNGYNTDLLLKLTTFDIQNDRYEISKDYIPRIVFSHPFAKAFWGKSVHDAGTDMDGGVYECSQCKMPYGQENRYCWQSHLQQMVLLKNPIEYLEQFLPKNRVDKINVDVAG